MDIAVVVATYNQAEYVPETLDSVLAQSHQPSQIVVTDDGSVDGTQDVIEEYAKRYPDTIVPVLGDENRGIAKNFNAGLRAVSSDAVTFLAGDDRYRPQKLEQEAETLQRNPDVGVVYSNFAYVDEEGDETRRWTETQPPTGTVLVDCLTRNWPDGSLFRNPMVSWDVIEQVGFFDGSFEIYEDWDLKIRLSANTDVAYCDTVLTEYRLHNDGISTTSDWNLHAEMFERIQEKHRERILRLEEDERRHVERTLEAKIHQHRAFAAREDGSLAQSLREYAAAIRTDPNWLYAYVDHLRFFLPRPAFRLLALAKRRITG